MLVWRGFASAGTLDLYQRLYLPIEFDAEARPCAERRKKRVPGNFREQIQLSRQRVPACMFSCLI
jgi:hypothetical protein